MLFFLRSSSFFSFFWGSLHFFHFFLVVFIFHLRLSSFFFSHFFWVVFIFFSHLFEVVFIFLKFLFKVVFHFFFWGRLFSWVKIRLHTENQLPKLSGSALKVVVWSGGVGGPTDYFVTPNLSWGWVGLWQKEIALIEPLWYLPIISNLNKWEQISLGCLAFQRPIGKPPELRHSPYTWRTNYKIFFIKQRGNTHWRPSQNFHD